MINMTKNKKRKKKGRKNNNHNKRKQLKYHQKDYQDQIRNKKLQN